MAGSLADIRWRYEALSPVLDERGRRRFAAAEASTYGHGGVSAVARVTGMARSTIARGVDEIEQKPEVEPTRIRKPGGGRKLKRVADSTLLADLRRLVEPATRGDPMRTLLWTSKSLRHLSEALAAKGHSVCANVVADCLRELGYSLQANRKTREGSGHMDRNAQFQYLNDQATAFLKADEPVISVDTKKKELVGNYKNNGREWRPQATPEAVNVHDFIDPKLGRAVPYGVYDIADNKGWVSVGTDHDTASFAVQAIRRWWMTMGRERYPRASRLMITADGGGSNGHRVRLWKIELQALADELHIPITVCHLPPGTSKWNKIEHRLFSFITLNWRGKPLRSFRTIVQLIAATTTTTGLTVRAELDENKYPKGVKISDVKFAAVQLQRHSFHGDWNYTISPH
ncbi:MAG: ISAzo13 family transposase [Acidimicrobiales bacterium]